MARKIRLGTISRKLGASSETLSVGDPWEFGVNFELRSAKYPPFVRHVKRGVAESGLSKNQGIAVGRVLRRRMEEAAASGLGEEAEIDWSADDIQNEIWSLVDEGRIDITEVIGSSSANATAMAEAIAKHLIVTWSGNVDEGGEEIPYTVSAGVELLTDPTETELGEVGDVLRRHLLDAAGWKAGQEERAEEEAQKNSSRSPDGTGPSVTDTDAETMSDDDNSTES